MKTIKSREKCITILHLVNRTKSICGEIRQLLKLLKVVLAWYAFISSNDILSSLKHSPSKELKSNLVYKVKWTTGLPNLKKHCYQQFYLIKNNNPGHSGLVQHSIERLHWFDFQNIKILHNCDMYFKRLVIESVYINLFKNNYNIKSEINQLFLDCGFDLLWWSKYFHNWNI